jgi:hypothetical protein
MLKGKISNYGKMVRERGRMFLSHVMNFYTEDRWIPVDEDGMESLKAINGRKLIVPSKLTVVSGSMMLKSKVAQREEALELYNKGAIDSEELLKKIDWSDWKQVVKRMQAGPFGELFEKLSGMMDMKEFETSVDKGEIPSFMAMIQAMSGETPAENPMESAELEAKQAEIQTKMAQIDKVMTEIELLKAKIQSEYVDQNVKKAPPKPYQTSRPLKIKATETLHG